MKAFLLRLLLLFLSAFMLGVATKTLNQKDFLFQVIGAISFVAGGMGVFIGVLTNNEFFDKL